jgi:hypothetical protein
MATEVHASRLLTTIPFPVSDLLKPAYSFGGLPLIQMGKAYVDNWLAVRQGTTDIVLAYSIFALATEMGDVLNGGAGEELEERVKLFNKWRSNNGTFVYDKEKEDFNADTDEAGHRFRFEAGRGSDLKSATGRLLPRIEVMMFCLAGLVKRSWIWASAK